MQPNNPIVGGTALRIPAIQSPNFIAGVQGWQIKQDGTASFEDVTITSGSLTIVGSAGGVFVYSGTPAAGNLILSIAGASGTDAFGNAYPQGFATSATSGDQIIITPQGPGGLPEIDFFSSVYPGQKAEIFADNAGRIAFTGFPFTSNFGDVLKGYAYLSNQQDYFGFANNITGIPEGGFVQINDNSIEIGINAPSGGGNSPLILQGQNSLTSTLPVQVGVWANVSFNTNWSNFGGGYSNGQWRLCSDGFIHFRGLITVTAAPADNTLAFAIPLAGQPPASKELPLLRINGVAAATACRLNITVSGGQVNFSIFGAGTGTNFSLEGLFYESNSFMA